MTGFEYAKQFDTDLEKMSVLVLDAFKAACNMAEVDYESLTDIQKMDVILKTLKSI